MEPNPKEKAALEELRSLIASLDASEDVNKWICESSNLQRLKFLMGHKLDVKKVLDLMKNCSKWRYENKMDAIEERMATENSLQVRFAKAYLPAYVLGKDAEGRSVILNHMGVVDYPRIVQDYGLDKAMQWAAYTLELALNHDNPLRENIVIMNLGHEGHPNPPITGILELKTWISNLVKYVQALSAIADPYYPETTHKLIFLNAPSMFWGVWKLVKVFVNERTAQKVEVHSSKEASNKRILEILPAEMVPTSLGGLNALKGRGKGGKLPIDGCNNEEYIAQLEKVIQEENNK